LDGLVIGGEHDSQVADLRHIDIHPCGTGHDGDPSLGLRALFFVPARRRMRRRGSLRSVRLSPTRVTPSTTSTIATPGNTLVHQMPLVTSCMARFRSYPHSAAAVASMPKPRKPRPARVSSASEAFRVRITGSDRVELRSTCRSRMRVVGTPITFAESTN